MIKATGIAYSDYRTQIDNHNAVPAIAAGEDATQTPGSHAPAAGFAVAADTAQSLKSTDNAADSSTHEMQPDNRIADIDIADADVQANTLPASALEPDLFAELEAFIATSDLPDKNTKIVLPEEYSETVVDALTSGCAVNNLHYRPRIRRTPQASLLRRLCGPPRRLDHPRDQRRHVRHPVDATMRFAFRK
ncbi:hypothetical protein [Rhodococcus sp. OK302]|uniref:hypothetical protein n=1 Tax=Rhodococcus sp. OK302 TaxID=1882769 RepID=UPI000B9F0C7B|nr:hypothetical protein BDB13_6184 [Rhodococcus sp. OK302]